VAVAYRDFLVNRDQLKRGCAVVMGVAFCRLTLGRLPPNLRCLFVLVSGGAEDHPAHRMDGCFRVRNKK
jgi:hypothetical protein